MYVGADFPNCIFSTHSFLYFFCVHESFLFSQTMVQILYILFNWRIQHQPKFPSATALWVARIEIPVVSPLFAHAGLPSTKRNMASGHQAALVA